MHVVGVDIGCDTFVAYVPQVKQPHSFENTPRGWEAFKTWMLQAVTDSPPEQIQVVMEATGIYWTKLSTFLHQQGFGISVVNPAQVKYFARTKLMRSKTDAVDARLIQDYGLVMQPALWTPTPEVVARLQSTVKELDDLKELERIEKNRLHALVKHTEPTAELQTLHHERLLLFVKQRRVLEALLDDLLQDELLRETVELLVSVPGIGKLTAALFIAETTLFQGLGSGRAIGAYAGLSPALKHSGNSTPKAHISKVGNFRLRSAAYMAANGASRSHSPVGEYFRRLRAQGKPGKVALCAVARKILSIALAVFHSGKKYDPEIHRQKRPVIQEPS